MTSEAPIAPLAQQVSATVRQVMDEIRPQLVEAALTGNRGESDNPCEQQRSMC